MQPLVHESGNNLAIEYAKKAYEAGLTTMFNDDPQKSVDTFDFYKKYTFFHPDTNKDDKNVFATLVRECVHFEVETVASMLTFGLDLNMVYPQVTLSYMNKSCRAILQDKYPNKGIDNAFAETFAKELVQQVYKFVQAKLQLPDMSWDGVSAMDL
jgi:hypothetical protein